MITLKFEGDNVPDVGEGAEIYLNNLCIGSITSVDCGDSVMITNINIDEPYRNKKYGTVAMNKFIDAARDNGFKCIEGESPEYRKPFYKRLGAKFENRIADYDEHFINQRFYIDL